jgi:serralysin
MRLIVELEPLSVQVAGKMISPKKCRAFPSWRSHAKKLERLLLVSWLACGVVADLGCGGVSRAVSLDRSQLGRLTFSDEFNSPRLSLYDPVRSPHGRWKTCYWFGWQPGGACVNGSSRDVGPQDPSIVSDPGYNGLSPFSLSDGALLLRVLPANPKDPRNDGKSWAVGMVSSQPSFSQRYGYFEIKTTMPGVRGTWPAFWMLAANLKPPQEIDIFENMGVDPTRILCTANWQDKAPSSSSYVTVPGSVTQPHIYGLLWTANTLVWYLDDVEVKRTANRDLHDPMYLMISGGVGGWRDSGNLPIDASRINGAAMAINYVRAYELRR